MLVFQRSGVYIDMGSHRNTLLCFRYLSAIAFHQWSSERVYFTLIFCFKIGYVEQIKQLLFTMTKQERETIKEKYKAKIPEPLTNQFPARASKDTAVRRHRARKQLQTELFPSGI